MVPGEFESARGLVNSEVLALSPSPLFIGAALLYSCRVNSELRFYLLLLRVGCCLRVLSPLHCSQLIASIE